MEQKYTDLIKKAIEIRRNAYVPYSNYSVGAALLCKNGDVYVGCNIENAAFTPTICAERVAIFGAVKDGKRDFDSIAIVAGKKDFTELDYASPCGVCRQVMTEFCKSDFKIILPKIDKSENPYDVKIFSLDEILPFRFKEF